MQVLLSSIGSRGDVQPILALALELRALGHGARLCVPPNFKEWIESYGLECTPIGPDVRKMTGGSVPAKPVLPSPERLQQLADESVREQFRVVGEAAQGADARRESRSGPADLIVAMSALQIAARSVAESRKIPYIFASICPAVLPSAKYPPPKTGGAYSQTLPEADNLELWKRNDAEFNARFGAALNAERARLGLGPVPSVRDHMFTDRPWLAADAALGPAFPLPGMQVVQTGAWMLSGESALPEDAHLKDAAHLSDEIEHFLAAGAPPIYLGFGSMRASEQTGRVLVEAARGVGQRAILSQGWAGLTPGVMAGRSGPGDDCLLIGDVDQAALFPRMAAIVHHGGAGTTHAAARSGRPQVIVPHNYDQFYWAHRVQQLGIGASGPTRDDLTTGALVQALRECLTPETAARAQALAGRMELHGARIAAQRITEEFG